MTVQTNQATPPPRKRGLRMAATACILVCLLPGRFTYSRSQQPFADSSFFAIAPPNDRIQRDFHPASGIGPIGIDFMNVQALANPLLSIPPVRNLRTSFMPGLRYPHPTVIYGLDKIEHPVQRPPTTPWLIRKPFLSGLVLAASFGIDSTLPSTRDSWESNRNLQDASRTVSRLGSGITLSALGAGVYLSGLALHHKGMRTTGLDLVKGLIISTLIVLPMKYITGRERPMDTPNHTPYDFDPIGREGVHTSFPSGHTTLAWMTATVIARHNPRKTWVKILVYTLASAVALARVTGNDHHPSDIVTGAYIGYTIGFLLTR